MFIYNSDKYYIQDIYEANSIDIYTKKVKIIFSNNLFNLNENKQIELYQKFNITRIINLQKENSNIDNLQIFHCPLPNLIDLNLNNINILANQLTNYPSINILKKNVTNYYENLIFNSQLKNIINILKAETEGNTLIMSEYGIHRTGIIISLLLEIFNFPRELNFNYYFQSNQFYHKQVNELMEKLREYGLPLEHIIKLPYLLGADLDYIKALFKIIDTKYHSIELYCLKRLKLTENDIYNLKEIYL